MIPTPTGRLIGRDLVLRRTFRAEITDVWASITEPARTARWFGSWSGQAGPGRTIQLTMGFEDGAPVSDVRIDACDPPRRLALSAVDDYGSWRMTLELSERDGVTELLFTHHLGDDSKPADVGPGWEYYLDNLVATRDGVSLPSFDDYDPAQRPYYEALAPTDSP